MRRLDIELPRFDYEKYDDKGNVILKIPTPVDAYIQDVMPRKLLKQALGMAGVDSGESSPSETEDTTYAIKSLDLPSIYQQKERNKQEHKRTIKEESSKKKVERRRTSGTKSSLPLIATSAILSPRNKPQ